MTTINQNQKNPTPQARMEVEAINVKPQEAISVIGSGTLVIYRTKLILHLCCCKILIVPLRSP
ncbi:hypothetical protein PN483_17750 [Nodularia spumigena CS-591/04]|uniref:hypothetical protein n=1 Tax=Nodularia spumigena TaxID=70799 RepID=UPI00232C69F1|nr:hypothetical protein [Nodularia spumigena]MDB9320489.1 hypothetical protein [Nodularia spumigena CS-591/07A]MDB9332307.1 hypothetical protein [Nodularia spumigena CS-591/04]MDB9362709.1 hypothetical protein [Nodularia spumigena CS-588/02]MDB9364601.1 hypothetical protein [Nodularia spumigena CS-588/02A10]